MKFWMSRIFPTIMVMYDATNDCGYYGFLGDALHNPAHLINVPTKTITLKFDTKYVLNKDSWNKIEKAVETYYSNLVYSLYWVRNTINLFPYINKIVEAIQLIHMAQSNQPRNEQEEFLKRITLTMAHKSAVIALTEMRDKFRIERANPNMINHFINFYTKEVKKFIPDFEKVLTTKENIAFYMNDEIMYKETPRLAMDLLQFLKDLTGENGLEKTDLSTKKR
jgi:hypothetical protein